MNKPFPRELDRVIQQVTQDLKKLSRVSNNDCLIKR